jgi:hypothetical protein
MNNHSLVGVLVLCFGCSVNEDKIVPFKASGKGYELILEKAIPLTGPETWIPPSYLEDFKIVNERIYFADGATSQVCAHRMDGSWIFNIGEPGQGPGEFKYPHGVCVSGNKIHVLAMRKHMVFDLNGKFLKQNGKIENIPPGIPGQTYAGPDGSAFLTICSNLSPEASVFHVDENAALLARFSPPDQDFVRFWHAVIPNGFLVINDKEILQVFCHKYEVVVFDFSGTEKRRIQLASSAYTHPDHEALDLKKNFKKSTELFKKTSYIDGFFRFGKGFVFSHCILKDNKKFAEFWSDEFFGLGRATISANERLVGTFGDSLIFFDSDKASLVFRKPVLTPAPTANS